MRVEHLQGDAAAVTDADELIEKGTLEDLTGRQDVIERELATISLKTQVETELSRLKTEEGK